MSQNTENPDTSELSRNSKIAEFMSHRRIAVIALVSFGIGYFPLLTEHFLNLWLRPHYQFAVFVPIAVAILWRRGYIDLRKQSIISGNNIYQSASPVLWVPVTLVSLIVLGAATYLRSPWLAMLSFNLSAFAAISILFGVPGINALLAGWIFQFVALPLPGNLDVRLISRLRVLTTEWASTFLDYFGVLHRLSGNVIDIPGISLFVADACTGIHSLFVLSAAALLWSLWQRRTAIHTLILVLCTSGLVVVENITRVCMVTYLCQTNPLFSEGWRHASLGVLLFTISLLLVISLDSLILFFLPIHDWRPGMLVLLRRFRPLTAEPPEPPAIQSRPISQYVSRWLMPVYFTLVLLGFIQLTWFPSQAKQFMTMLRRNPISIPSMNLESLPVEIDGWKRLSFKEVKRVLEDPMGEHSHVWTYEKNGRTALVSIDYPYLRIHDLSVCYEAVGWQPVTKRILQRDSSLPFISALLRQPLYGDAQLAYSLHSMDGHCEVAIDEELAFQQIVQKRFEIDRPWFQIQAFFTNTHADTSDKANDINLLFLTGREAILKRVTENQ